MGYGDSLLPLYYFHRLLTCHHTYQNGSLYKLSWGPIAFLTNIPTAHTNSAIASHPLPVAPESEESVSESNK